MDHNTKSHKIKLYEALERVDPEIIVHLSVQAAIDESANVREACDALYRLLNHVRQACETAGKMLPEEGT